MKSIEIYYEDFKGHVDYIRHACRGIIVKGNQILLIYERNEDRYLTPGGGIEDNETKIDCLKREILEETGLLVTPKNEFLEIIEYFYWKRNWKHIQHYFICEVNGDSKSTSLTKSEKEAGAIAKWISFNQAIEIFANFEKFKDIDKATFGLYKRELIALKEFLKQKEII